MSRRKPAEPIFLTDKRKRLKSLDEFEAPYWLGSFKVPIGQRSKLWPLLTLSVSMGAAIGWFLLPHF